MSESLEQILRFPAGSVGRVFMMQPGAQTFEDVKACGDVAVPAGWIAQLRIGEDTEAPIVEDVSFLRSLPPQTFQNISFAKPLADSFDASPLSGLEGLESLALSEGTTDRVLSSIGSRHALTRLTIVSTKLTDAGTSVIGGLEKLTSLYLSCPALTDETVRSLRGLRLNNLTLHMPQLTDQAMAVLAEHSALNMLAITSDEVTDESLAHIASLPELGYLALSCPRVTGSGLGELAHLEKLGTLSLAGSGVTDDAVAALRGWGSLRSLDLSGTAVTDAGTPDLVALPPEVRNISLRRTRMSERARYQVARDRPGTYLDGVRYSPRALEILLKA